MSDTPEGPDGANYRALRMERLDDVLVVTIDHPESPLNAVDGLLHEESSSYKATALFGAIQLAGKTKLVRAAVE